MTETQPIKINTDDHPDLANTAHSLVQTLDTHTQSEPRVYRKHSMPHRLRGERI